MNITMRITELKSVEKLLLVYPEILPQPFVEALHRLLHTVILIREFNAYPKFLPQSQEYPLQS
jgi:hypothetical protein